MLKKILRTSNLKYVVAFLVPIIFTLMTVYWLDNDSWDVLAEGREIVQNGIYYTDQLSMHKDLEITVQNYGFAVLFYLIFSVLGAQGIYIILLVFCFLVELLVYKIAMLISGRKKDISLLVMVLTGVTLVFMGFVTTRAQMVSFVIFLGLIYLLELFIKSGEKKYLFLLPLLAILQVNIHASLFWMLILVTFVYIIDSIRAPRLHLQGYKTKPLLFALIAMLFCGFLNPYGFKMISFIFTSYNSLRFHDMISELQPFAPLHNLGNIVFYTLIVFVVFSLIFGDRKNIRIRYLLMFFGFLVLGLNTVKGMSQFILVMFFPLALLYKDVTIKNEFLIKAIRVGSVWAGMVVALIFGVTCPLVVSQISNRPEDAFVRAMDKIDEDSSNKNRKELKIYSGYGAGAYVEYRGYRPYIDPRGEVFLKKNNGKEDILYEWDDLQKGRISPSDFLKKYNFDYILADGENDPLYRYDYSNYEMIFYDEEEQIKVFRQFENLERESKVSNEK